MGKRRGNLKKVNLEFWFSEFEVPPVKDILIIGKRAPIGANAAKVMVECVSPGIYEVIPIDNEVVEAVIVKASLLHVIPRELLVDTVLEEAVGFMGDKMILKAQLDIAVNVKRSLEL